MGMYLTYYKLSKKPFQISTDPSFFWLGKRHKEALSILKYAVMDDKGFLLLTGDVGTGKTTLINTFVNSLGDEVIVSRVSDPGLTQLDFISYIAKLFKIKNAFGTKSEFLLLFTEFLEQADRDDKKVLLIIDEAQHLTDETLEEIRLLSNIENQDKKLLNIFLVGQSEFNETLEKHKNRALRQRLTLNYTLYPFEAEETKACIEYRLRVAGAEDDIFTPEAIDAIHAISNGFPRVINIICDHALRLGCQEEQKSISAAIVNQCSKTLYAAHLPQSHQYDSHFASANEWLEESEVPPLSPEAINRASQPLSDFILDDEADIKEKVRPYSAIVPFILAGLLISGFFLFKDDNLNSVSQFLTNLYTDTITSTAQKLRSIIDSSGIALKAEELFLSETIPASSNAPTPPIIKTKTQKKHTINTSKMVQIVDQPGINATAGHKTSFELDDDDAKMQQQEPVASDVTVPLSVNIEGNTSEEIMVNTNTEPEPSSTQILTNTEKPIVDEPVTTEAQAEDVSVDVETGPPFTPETGVPVDIEIKEHIPVTSDAPPPSSSKELSDTNDDPGAVIDWLLQSKQH